MATFATWNDKVWRRTVPILAEKYKRTIPQILNQFALDVVGGAFDLIRPIGGGNEIQAQRSAIKRLLTEPVSTRIKLFRRGKRKGQIGRRGSKFKQLQRVHLIAQYYRAKYGRKGLYGKDMTRYAGAMKQRRQVGVGSVKSVFIPMIRALNPLVKYKFPFDKTARISRWPGSRGYGIAKPAPEGTWSPRAILQLRYHARFHQEPKLQAMYDRAVSSAIEWKTGKMIRQAGLAFDEINRGFNRQQLQTA